MESIKIMDYKSIVASRPFRFLVGPEKREFIIHSGVVSRLSKSLDVLVNGQMMEACEDCAVWADVDQDTFVRFCKFAYTGDYDGAEPSPIVDLSDETKTEEARVALSKVKIPSTSHKRHISGRGSAASSVKPKTGYWDSSDPLPQAVTRDRHAADLWYAWIERYDVDTRWDPRLFQNRGDEDCTMVLLCHARLAVFADYHGISALETLALTKLAAVLATINLYKSATRNVAQLASYVYMNTVQLNNATRGLRDLVSSYSACEMEILWKSVEFQKVFETYPEFAKDLTDRLITRFERFDHERAAVGNYHH
ncbi:hypothetical protein BR93DRAFT_931373 [Coniochaeta sp. PMI_546]|nr:hypothetical protein BR93DRAFT_931373 [Coniochaeta sp. PMI_546]